MVGALIVKSGKIIAEGHHAIFGGPHAEIIALRKAGARAKGATLYCSLEPCTLQGKTPPCTDAIIAAGIHKVVYLARDPNPAVTDTAAKVLKKDGVDCEFRFYFSADYLNQGFSVWINKHRPLVTIKAAVSLDGRLADYRGISRGLGTGGQLNLTHELRKNADAILVGAGTVHADDPSLTIRRGYKRHRLIRVVLDRGLTVSPRAKIFSTLKDGPVWIIADPVAARSVRARRLRKAGAEILALKDRGSRFISELLKLLGQRGVTSLLVEGGARVHGRFLTEGYGDYFWIAHMPVFLGEHGVPLVRIGKVKLPDAPRIEFEGTGINIVTGRFRKGSG